MSFLIKIWLKMTDFVNLLKNYNFLTELKSPMEKIRLNWIGLLEVWKRCHFWLFLNNFINFFDFFMKANSRELQGKHTFLLKIYWFLQKLNNFCHFMSLDWYKEGWRELIDWFWSQNGSFYHVFDKNLIKMNWIVHFGLQISWFL